MLSNVFHQLYHGPYEFSNDHNTWISWIKVLRPNPELNGTLESHMTTIYNGGKLYGRSEGHGSSTKTNRSHRTSGTEKIRKEGG